MITHIHQILACIMAGIFLFSSACCASPLENPCPLAINAPAFILTEAGTDTVIFEENADSPQQAASLIKLMTLLLCFEALENGAVTPDAPVTVSEQAARTPGSTALLDANSTYRFEDLLRACIISSANDAAVALCECLAGTEEEFVARMNQKADLLGLKNTRYANCTGLSHSDQYTSARDCAAVASALSRYPAFFSESSKWLSTIVHPSGRVTDLTNTNRLVRFYEGCDGMKTGSSPEAGYCICASAQKNGMRLIAVILSASSSQQRFTQAQSMLEYGLSTYKRTDIIKRGELTGYTIPVLHGERDHVGIACGKGLSMLLKSGQEKHLSVELSLPPNITAPLPKDHPVGEIHVLLDGQRIATLPAVLSDDVPLPGFIEGFVRILDCWR